MECPNCGAFNENPVGSCLSCGAPLPEDDGPPTMMAPRATPKAPTGGARLQGSNVPPKQCPSCNTLNAATFKFCARCGTPLGATAVPQIQTKPPSSPGAKAATAGPASQPKLGSGTGTNSGKVAPGAPAAKPAPAAARPAQAAAPAAKAPPAAAPVAKPAPKAAPASAKLPPRPATKPAPVAPPKARARVSAIARDGSRSADFVLTREETRVGRAVAEGEVKLDKDPFIAPVHAVFRFEGEQLVVQDSGSQNGVFLWLKERALNAGDELRVGRQRLRIEFLPEEPEEVADQPLWGSPNPGYAARAVQLLEGGGEGDVYPLKTGENLVGRGTGDVSFPGDGYVSSRHATIVVGEGQLSVKDMGSANGTFVRISGQAPVSSGDLLLVGDQILRIDPA